MRVHATTCAYSQDGSLVGAGMRDGTVHLYYVRAGAQAFGYSAARQEVKVADAILFGKHAQARNLVSLPSPPSLPPSLVHTHTHSHSVTVKTLTV